MFALNRNQAKPEWLASNIVGLVIELDDPQKIEDLTFHDDGRVTATVGRNHGEIAAPYFDWRLAHGELQLLDGNSAWQELKIASRDTHWIVASDQDNRILKFKIIQDAVYINFPISK